MLSHHGRIPCTIVTGFLGSGKTTLIRNVLENAAGRRFALIINEFGDVGIDAEILEGCGIEGCGEDTIIELPNGCICCTVADDFQPALDAILSRRPRVDHVLIETSGLALPKPLVEAFNWPAIRSRATVDGVIAVVDGEALAEGRVAQDMDAQAAQRASDAALDHDNPVEEVFDDQIAFADLVVMSKTDLLTPEQLSIARHRIERELPEGVKLVEAQGGKLATGVVLGLDARAEDNITARRGHHHDGEHGEHNHDDFESFVIDLAAQTDADKLAERVRAAATLDNVLRIKGFVDIAGKPMRLVVQAVGARVATHYDRLWTSEEMRGTRLVVIGLKGIDRARLQRILAD